MLLKTKSAAARPTLGARSAGPEPGRLDDGRIEIDNNAAGRALRGVAVGRNNYLFMSSDAGGELAAPFYSLVENGQAQRA